MSIELEDACDAKATTEVWWAAELDGKPWQVRTTTEARIETMGPKQLPWTCCDARVEILDSTGNIVLPVWTGTGIVGEPEVMRHLPAVHEAETNAIRIAQEIAVYDGMASDLIEAYAKADVKAFADTLWTFMKRFATEKDES